jgi:excisionase family DNA binding protein
MGADIDWLTTGQAAKLLGVSRSTVMRHIDAGSIEGYRLPGGHWRIRRADLEKIVRDGWSTAGDGIGAGSDRHRS